MWVCEVLCRVCEHCCLSWQFSLSQDTWEAIRVDFDLSLSQLDKVCPIRPHPLLVSSSPPLPLQVHTISQEMVHDGLPLRSIAGLLSPARSVHSHPVSIKGLVLQALRSSLEAPRLAWWTGGVRLPSHVRVVPAER